MFSWFQKKRTAPVLKKLSQGDISSYWRAGGALSPSKSNTSSLNVFDSNSIDDFSSAVTTWPKTTDHLTESYTMLDRLNFDIYGFQKESDKLRGEIIAKTIKIKIKDNILKKLHRSIENLNDECEEEGFAAVSNQAKESAKQILNAVYNKFPDYEYHIYPTEDREIAFDCNPQKGKGVLILCDSKGGVAYFSTVSGRNSRFRCDCIADFPYEHLWKIFKQLDEKRISISALKETVSTTQNKLKLVKNSNNIVVSYSVYRKPSSEDLDNYKIYSYA